MCGRYVITSPPAAVRALFGYAEQPNFPPRYNVAPTQPIPVVRLHRWQALVRADALGIAAGLGEGPEDVSRSWSMRAANRCSTSPPFATPCGGGAASFRPMAFMNGGPVRRSVRISCGQNPAAPIAFAGLWETWTGPNGEEVDTAAIVTTRANRTLAADPRPHAGHRGAGGVRSLARLRQSRRQDRRRADRAGAESLCSNATRFRRRSIAWRMIPPELIAPAAAGGAVQPAAASPAAPAKPKKPNDQPSLF